MEEEASQFVIANNVKQSLNQEGIASHCSQRQKHTSAFFLYAIETFTFHYTIFLV